MKHQDQERRMEELRTKRAIKAKDILQEFEQAQHQWSTPAASTPLFFATAFAWGFGTGKGVWK